MSGIPRVSDTARLESPCPGQNMIRDSKLLASPDLCFQGKQKEQNFMLIVVNDG